MLSYHWQPKVKYVGHDFNVTPTTILTASYRDPRTSQIATLSVDPRQPRNDRAIVKKLHALLSWACKNNVVLLYQNGDRFDLPKMESRFIYYGLEPLGRMLTIDTLREARKFGFDYCRLDYLDKHLGGPGKVAHETGMWMAVVQGKTLAERKAALTRMIEYNEGDIDALERVYARLRGYMKTHPNANLWTGREANCPTCGSPSVSIGRPVFTPTRAYRRRQCSNKLCRRQFRDKRSLEDFRVAVTNQL
jgi:hypothetical protein